MYANCRDAKICICSWGYYLTDLLHDAECPVLVVPEEFNPPEQLVLAYDGSRASVFAIRQFCFLFPGLCGLPATLVYAGPANDKDESLPEEPYVEELAAGLFSNLNIRHLELAPGTGFAAGLSGLPAPLLISGSFGRSLLSQVFRESFAQKVVDYQIIPVFIAHK